jgi:hypothetical protein
MKPYDEMLKQIPKEAWQYVEAEFEESEDGEGMIQFFWDDEEHPELKPLSQLDEEQWTDFVHTSLNRALDLDNEIEATVELGNRYDGSSGELAGEPDSQVPD